MELPIDSTQLDCELQEMYIICSHWKADVDFVKDEIRFLKKTLNKYKTSVGHVQLISILQFQKIIVNEEATIHKIESKIYEFLELMGPIVNHAKNEFGLGVLEKFNGLETDIKAVTNYILLLKRLIFSFLETTRNEKKPYQAALANKKLLPLKYKL